jgi:hypothetical protein
VDPVDRAILCHPLTEESCLRGPSELVLCLPEDRGKAGFSNVTLHQKLDNEKSPPKKDFYVSESHTTVRAPRQLNVLYRHFHALKIAKGGWRAVILCSDK